MFLQKSLYVKELANFLKKHPGFFILIFAGLLMIPFKHIDNWTWFNLLTGDTSVRVTIYGTEDVPKWILTESCDALEDEYFEFVACNVSSKTTPLPVQNKTNFRYNPEFKTHQYLTHTLHNNVYAIRGNEDIVVLLTTKHLFPDPKWNYVFGQADMKRRIALISTYMYNFTPNLSSTVDPELFRFRLRKVVVHEVGHALGYRHHSNPKCVMAYGDNLSDLDSSDIKLCPDYKAILPEQAYYTKCTARNGKPIFCFLSSHIVPLALLFNSLIILLYFKREVKSFGT